jgi:hypothetical protein
VAGRGDDKRLRVASRVGGGEVRVGEDGAPRPADGAEAAEVLGRDPQQDLVQRVRTPAIGSATNSRTTCISAEATVERFAHARIRRNGELRRHQKFGKKFDIQFDTPAIFDTQLDGGTHHIFYHILYGSGFFFFEVSVTVQVDDGSRALFWSDRWLNGCSILQLAPDLERGST